MNSLKDFLPGLRSGYLLECLFCHNKYNYQGAGQQGTKYWSVVSLVLFVLVRSHLPVRSASKESGGTV